VKRQLRFGSVPYLNALPLIHGLEDVSVTLLPPAQLAERCSEFDAALLPLFEILRRPSARVVDGIGIGCDGPVRSVIIKPWSPSTKCVACDPDSRMSNALLQVLLQGSKIKFAQAGEASDAQLIIGDPALKFRSEHPDIPVRDLGEWWNTLTGLPFVFACWWVSESAPQSVADELRASAKTGLASIPEILRNRHPDIPNVESYLTSAIKYQVGDEQHKAIDAFSRRAQACGILPRPGKVQWI